MSDPRYHTTRWRAMRARQLQKEPFCAFCAEDNRVVVATVADHKTPHRGNALLFWAPCNLQSLCAECHSSTKQAQENVGQVTGVDGWPVP